MRVPLLVTAFFSFFLFSLSHAFSASYITTASLGGFIPLGGSLVVLGNTSKNTIDLFNVDIQQTIIQIPINGVPKRMALDPDSGIVYVSDSSSKLVRVNLLAGTVTYISLPNPSLDVFVSSTSVYVLTSALSSSALVVVLDKNTLNIKSTAKVDDLANGITAASDDSFFITAEFSYSGGLGGAYRYTYVGGPQSNVWNFTQVGITNENSNTIVLSPDNQHVELVCGGGNGNGYSIGDYDSSDFTVVNGYFETGAYPLGGAYTPDQSLFITSNYTSFLVFDATRYDIISVAPIYKPNGYLTMTSVKCSTDGLRGYAYGSSIGGGGFLYWFDLPN